VEASLASHCEPNQSCIDSNLLTTLRGWIRLAWLGLAWNPIPRTSRKPAYRVYVFERHEAWALYRGWLGWQFRAKRQDK
jgi:hypothetical protein